PLNITRLDPAESHGGTRGKVKGMDGSTHLFAVRDKVSVPAHLDALFRQLLRHRSAVAASGHENQDALLLEFTGQGHGLLIGGQRAHTGGKSRHATVHQLDALSTQYGVVRKPDERGRWTVLRIEVLERLDDFFGDQGGDSRIKGRSQIRKPEAFARHLGEQDLHLLQCLLAVFQLFDLFPQHGQDQRQIVARIGIRDACFRAVLFNGRTQSLLCQCHVIVRATNGGCGNNLGHGSHPHRFNQLFHFGLIEPLTVLCNKGKKETEIESRSEQIIPDGGNVYALLHQDFEQPRSLDVPHHYKSHNSFVFEKDLPVDSRGRPIFDGRVMFSGSTAQWTWG